MSTKDTTPATNNRRGTVAVTPDSSILKGIPRSNTFSPSWSFSTTRTRDEAKDLRDAFGKLVNSGQIPFIEGKATKSGDKERVRLKIDYTFNYNLDEYTIDDDTLSILRKPDHALRIKRLYLNSGLRLEQIKQLLLAFRILRKQGVGALKSAYGDVTDIEYDTDMNMDGDADAADVGDELLQGMSLSEVLKAVTNRIEKLSGAQAKAHEQELQKLANAIENLDVDGNGGGGESKTKLVADLQLKLRF